MERAQEFARRKGGQLLKYNGKYKSLWSCSEGHKFFLTEYKVKRRGKWCLTCGASIGERTVRQILQYYKIPFLQQMTISRLPGRYFDFAFQYNEKNFLLEYDGEQHFGYVRKYHKTKAKFHQSQQVDRMKSQAAIASGYYLIRIDYTQRDFIWQHFWCALYYSAPLYLSRPQLYTFL